MKTISHHYEAIVATFKELFAGNFLLYFIPGSVLTILFFWFTYSTRSIEESLLIEADSSWINWVKGAINTGVHGVFSFFGFLMEQVYIFGVITLLSPFNTMLSEKLENKLIGTEYKSSLASFINDFFRMVFVVFIAVSLELTFLAFYWFISFIFGLGAIDDIVFFMITSFFFGLSFYDFSLERDRVNVFGTIAYAFSHPLSMILTGSIFLLIYAIPIIGIPIAPVLSVMIATIVYLYLKKRLPKQHNDLKENE